ncbi:tubulin polyglutamylase TTLL4 [Lingula anatina]|uniref:Tubulin polyglutamylase TTLL4 n=1 Tax=Lingula anatina TaxID=7574 RepID=A0A1S3ILH4_LINAN|nr:tubulin polyglutamylase TTLL4 [Lingula anatina]|eukprot:XP_013398741.1 tubulin polyglutamylase TTLL4 [Lingula anatina]
MESALVKMTRSIMDCCICVTVILLLANSANVSGESPTTHSAPLNECPVKLHIDGEQGPSARISDCSSGKPVSLFTEGIAEEIEVKDNVLPALTPSLFSNVPPTINFVRPDQKVEELPQTIRDRLKYYASPSSPIAFYVSLSGFTQTQDVWEYIVFYGLPYQINMARDYLSVLPHQKFNHIPDSWALGCKDQLGRNLQRFKAKYGEEDYGIFPETFVLPEDKVALKRAWNSSDKHRTWLLKPPCAFGGRGIEVVQDWKKVPKKEHTVVQRYISNPLLVNGSKIDLRVYVHVTSINPLRIYVNPEGLVRISVEKYTMKDINNRAIHLTNKDINDKNSLYYVDEQLAEGNRR